jgi:hypothetical protein
VFQTFFRDYSAIVEQNTQRMTDENGHQITTIAAFLPARLTQLTDQFWTELDSVLDGRQLTLGRKVVWLNAGMFEPAAYGVTG